MAGGVREGWGGVRGPSRPPGVGLKMVSDCKSIKKEGKMEKKEIKWKKTRQAVRQLERQEDP